MLYSKAYKLACDHTVRLVAVPTVLEINLLGRDEANRTAESVIRSECRDYCCSEYACRKRTKKPTHPSL